jgi:hypothetical protein
VDGAFDVDLELLRHRAALLSTARADPGFVEIIADLAFVADDVSIASVVGGR